MNPAIIVRDGWRVFFLAAGLYAVLAMLAWLVWLGSGGTVDLQFAAAPPIQWHAHEMIFGFTTATLAGFFLTAMPNWTDTESASARFITLLAVLWLAGRIAIWFSGSLPALLVAVIDLAFLPVLAARVLAHLLHRPKPQNVMFSVLLLVIWTANLLVHLDWMGWTATEPQGQRAGLMVICAMIAVVGGRIVPAFTRNALNRSRPDAPLPVSRRPLDVMGAILVILTAILVLVGAPAELAAVLAIGAGLVAIARLIGWQTRQTLDNPILWTLHVSYAMLALGLLAWGFAGLGLGSEVGALHILGVGAVGGMTLAVMSRASIGHSGRALRAPPAIVLSYVLIPVAALLRWAAAEWPGPLYSLGTLGAGALWTLAFTLYVVALWSIWTTPRPVAEA